MESDAAKAVGLLLRKRILLEDFAAANLKLWTLQASARKEAQFLEEIVDYLKREGGIVTMPL